MILYTIYLDKEVNVDNEQSMDRFFGQFAFNTNKTTTASGTGTGGSINIDTDDNVTQAQDCEMKDESIYGTGGKFDLDAHFKEIDEIIRGPIISPNDTNNNDGDSGIESISDHGDVALDLRLPNLCDIQKEPNCTERGQDNNIQSMIADVTNDTMSSLVFTQSKAYHI